MDDSSGACGRPPHTPGWELLHSSTVLSIVFPLLHIRVARTPISSAWKLELRDLEESRGKEGFELIQDLTQDPFGKHLQKTESLACVLIIIEGVSRPF